jgi:hypothetical protein
MLQAGRFILVTLIVALVASCGLSSYEQRGDASYRRAQKLGGLQKRQEQKMAYTMYQRALTAHPDKISVRLRSRFLELSLARASMVLDEGSVSSDAIPLFRSDIEKYLESKDVPPKIRQDYALFLVQMADSFAVKERYQESLRHIDMAISYASDPASLIAKKQSLVGKVSKENLDVAQAEYENGKQNKDDAEASIRAEYYTLVAILFDSTNSDAVKLLSVLRKDNAGTYSAYLKAIQNIPDSSIFRKVNKYDILLAIPTVTKGGNVGMEINMYNYSFNPLRMKAENFFLVDKAGKRYQAMPAKFTPEILDQEHEGKYKLSFPRPADEIAKLVYENGPHYTEKCFF